MTTTTDIGNRALQLLGTRTTMASLTESSNEALQISIALAPVTNWCFGIANWNFARNTVGVGTNGLTLAKGPPPVTPGAWTSVYPAPPWLYEYQVTSDFIRALYLTNSDAASVNSSASPGWIGEPKRFVVALDTIASVQQKVILTNEPSPVLMYTAYVADPTQWPWYFERLVVTALAQTVAFALTGDKKLSEELVQLLEQQVNISMQVNSAEGLTIPDSTPEWIQAIGINYPFRRVTPATAPEQPQQEARR